MQICQDTLLFHGSLFSFQTLSVQERTHFLRVSARLNAATAQHWPFADLDTLRQAILPSEADLLDGSGGKAYLIVPRDGGSLHGLVQRNQWLSEQQARDYFGQIVRLVAFCHALGIVVRDLKLRKFVFVDQQQ